jgi:pimeloyl-ACP methyl ester carboxylesterase
MAGDLRRLLRQHLGVGDPTALVGHDIGLMIAYAYAQAHRDEVSHLAVVDAPLPVTAVFDRIRSDPRVWHFGFRSARNVAEMLVAGRERPYLQAFFNARIFDLRRSPTAIWTAMRPPMPHREPCAPASSSIAPSIKTQRTIATP